MKHPRRHRSSLFRLRVVVIAISLGWLSTAPGHAHIGSPNVVFEALAGNVPVRVIIRPPGVVPGLAQIDVRVLTNGVSRVTALPVHWRAGLEGAPPPDVCQPVPGEPDLYHAELWLMATGAYSVHVAVETAHGSGKVIVPVNSLATTRLPMAPPLMVILIGLGLLLFFLAISVVGAAVRESVLEPGLPISPHRRWLGRAATATATLLIGVALVGGKTWWDNVDRDYRNNRMFKPVPVTAVAQSDGERRILRLTVETNKAGHAWASLVPDHGRLMHLFLLRAPNFDAFAHLHPVRRSSTVFESVLPDLPPGEYRIYADVTHETGFSQTLTASLTLASPAQSPEKTTAASDSGLPASYFDAEDSFLIAPLDTPTSADSTGVPANVPAEARRYRLGGGLTMVWDEPTIIRSATPTTFRFRVLDETGKPARLEAYLGMLSHLILTRDDGSVFTHLHPAGTISMASQQVFQIRAGDKPPKRITAAMMEQLCQPPGPEMLQQPISFPYEFPQPGRYTIWVQVKAGGVVRTAKFAVVAG